MLRRSLIVLAWALGALAFVLVPGVPPICLLRLTLHVPCPSCGLTRAARDALHGDFAGATHVHPLWWLVLPFLAAVVGLEARDYIRRGTTGRWGQHRGVQAVGLTILGLMLIVWGARAMGAFGGPVSVE